METIEEGHKARETEIETKGWIFIESNCKKKNKKKSECKSANKIGGESSGRRWGERGEGREGEGGEKIMIDEFSFKKVSLI